jgi:hypothetical protein
VVLLAIFVLGYLSWLCIEQPFRSFHNRSARMVLSSGAVVVSAVLLTSVAVVGTSGFQMRLTPEQRKVASFLQYDHYHAYSTGRCFISSKDVELGAGCIGGSSVLLVGDSFAAHLRPGLMETYGQIDQATGSGCEPLVGLANTQSRHCRAVFKQIFGNSDARPYADAIVLAANWSVRAVSDIRNTVATLQRTGARIIVIGPTPLFKQPMPILLLKSAILGRPNFMAVNRVRDQNLLDEALRNALHGIAGVSYFSALQYLCHARDECTLYAYGDPVAWDHGHLTSSGSRYLAEGLVASGLLQQGDQHMRALLRE